jgi:uncharacterized C2H2 Zn-finger protein
MSVSDSNYSTHAHIQALAQALSQASTQASAQASTQASAQVSAQASTQASAQVSAQASSLTVLSNTTITTVCPQCHKSFTRRDNMLRHINEGRCKLINNKKNTTKEISSIEKKFAEWKEQASKEIAELKEQNAELKELTTKEIAEIKKTGSKPVNQVLQVICVTNNDNYLDMLTERMGDLGEAIEYIKDCALADVTGDCKLIEKINMNMADVVGNMHYADRGRTKIIYYNEKQEQVTETKTSMGKKLANNLQNSYLKGINCLINKNLDMKRDPNKLLEVYDLLTWNTHIYNLSDVCYQKKIINQLSIP